MIFIENAKVLQQKQLSPDFFRLDLAAPQIAAAGLAGQFVMVKTAPGYDPYLKRPFGISSFAGAGISLVYRLVGRGTKLMSELRSGDYLELTGPLGQPWQIKGVKKSLLVGGGTGIAPLVALAQVLKQQGAEIYICLGANDGPGLICREELAACGKVYLVTMDGSMGAKGLVTLILPGEIDFDGVYACGPKPMLAAVAAWAEKRDLPCQVSLEAHMGCGLGTCMGCVCPVKSRDGQAIYQRICREGPVFPAGEVIFHD
ncbi:MAG: dihydroorotate dehydrogenase electron transfer subunit [Clostridiales bacterium]|jgi:dihydroorotate dehydrogenase electron transfer subunit|nr:dihydroorotate dehydrogenase electron transfer subunit [Clostridiales bacterium]MDR2711555.1 dihydroorotate dehydrogenase electron transfer subunit [Clostridiales bacterium]